MSSDLATAEEYCPGCVYYPPNLPADAYPAEDYRLLQRKRCSFDFRPGDSACIQTRKTSCSLVDLRHLKQASAIEGDPKS